MVQDVPNNGASLTPRTPELALDRALYDSLYQASKMVLQRRAGTAEVVRGDSSHSARGIDHRPD